MQVCPCGPLPAPFRPGLGRVLLAGANPVAVRHFVRLSAQTEVGGCSAFVKEHGNQSDLLMDLVNYIGEAVEPEFPDLLIETLAYQYTRQVPQSIFPRKNILIRLCSIECDFSQPLDSESNRAFADDIRSWSKIAPLLYVWNYVTNFSKYYLPHPN